MQWLQRLVGLAILGTATLGALALWFAVAAGHPERRQAPSEGLLFVDPPFGNGCPLTWETWPQASQAMTPAGTAARLLD